MIDRTIRKTHNIFDNYGLDPYWGAAYILYQNCMLLVYGISNDFLLEIVKQALNLQSNIWLRYSIYLYSTPWQ